MNSDDSGSRTFAEVVGGVDDTDPGDELDRVVIREALVKALQSLSSREEKIIRLRFGLSEDGNDHVNFPITNKEHRELKKRGAK